ncbi:MAG: NFYB/HAP3 family transcription factor subunit [Candidatus Aenigmarchaeota archaeon]|nr:NFYB/HAP3 family transcription factor subunit [Candidatus Aenigmarchaeota archaeon]
MAEFFSLTPFERILKKAGAKRVSRGALEEFANVMEEEIFKIAKEAALLAKHAGRKTIIDADIRAARRKI